MRAWLAIAMVGAAFLTTSVWAQRGGHAGFSGARPAVTARASAMHGSFMTRPGFAGVRTRPAWSTRPFGNGAFGQPFVNGAFGFRGNFHHHHHGPFFGFGFGSPYYGYGYGYGGYYGYYPGYYYPYYPLFADSYDYGSSADAYNQQNSQLQQQVGQLSNEISVLQAEQEEQAEQAAQQSASQASTPPPPAAQASRETASNREPTTLVFRDGKTEQVQNYAIAGKTLWIFNEQRARRIPLSDLNIPATKQTNEDRGVTFQLP
jgi:hypothetical protein